MPVKSAYRPEENLSGYTTMVTDKSKKGLPTDLDRETESALPGGAATPGSAKKEDTADGNGRTIGQPSYNTPGTGEEGPAENPRSLPTPGEQEGNPTKFDYGMPTRRSMAAAYHPRMPWHKEHQQGQQDKLDAKKYYREHKGLIKRRVKLWYKMVKHDHRLKVKHKNREEKPKKYVRTKSPLVEKPRSHEKKTASCSTLETSYAWISPDGRVNLCADVGHTKWAEKYLSIQQDPTGNIPFWQRDPTPLGDAAMDSLLDEGWIRFSNFTFMEANRLGTPAQAWETAARLVSGCIRGKDSRGKRPDDWHVHVFINKREFRMAAGDFVTRFGGRRMADEMYESLMEKAAYQGWSPGQRRHKRMGPAHRQRHRDYMHNRSRSLRQHQRWYTRNHNKPAFKRRQRLRQEHPARYKMRFGAFAPAESIHFVFGPTMVQGQVDSVSLDTIAFSAVGTDEVLYLTPAAFLHAVVFLTPEDANSMFEVLDDEVGVEAFADLTDEDVRSVAHLYGATVADLFLDNPDDLHHLAVSIVETAMEGWDQPEMGERVASTYLRNATGEVVLYDQESPESGSWEKPDLEHKTPYKQDGPDQYRWDPGEKAPDPGTGGGMPTVDTTGFGGGSGKVIPDSMKYASGGCSTTETSYAWIAPDGEVHECHPLDHTEWAKKYVFEQKMVTVGYATWRRVDVIQALHILFNHGWIRASNFVAFEADRIGGSQAWESAAKMVVKCVSPITADKIVSVYQRSPWEVKDFEMGDFVQKFGGRRLAEEMFEKLNRTASVGPPCSPYTVSTAWVAPDGTYHDLHEGHRKFAERWLAAHDGIDMDSEPEEQMVALGWVKASNHFSFFAPSLVPSRALETLAKKTVECVQKNPALLDEEEVMLFTGAGEQRHDFKVPDFVQKYGGRQLAESLFTKIATGEPCDVTNVSTAWISPEGVYHELKHQGHWDFALKWLLSHGATDMQLDPEDQLVLLGWIKVSNQFSFLATSLTPSRAWETAAEKTARCIQKDRWGRLDANVLVFLYTVGGIDRHEFKVDQFVVKYGGRKMAEGMYKGRVAALTRSPCNYFESFAWIDPKGGYHLLRGRSHMEWAALWLMKKGVVLAHGNDGLEQAHRQLLEEGWVRVVSARAFQAVDLDQHPIQAKRVLEVLLRGVRDGCVKPDSKVWLLTGSMWGRGELQYTAADFANRLGGKKAEDQVYGEAMTKMAGACPIKTELYGGLPGNGGFDTFKEIGVGLANTFEAAHCVLGSLGRQQSWQAMRKTESGHISEEIGIIFRCIEEYSQQLYIDQLFEFSDYKPEWQEKARQSSQKQVEDILVSAPRLKGLATQKRDALGNLPPPVYDLAYSTYQFVISLCEASLEGVKGWPVSMKNPFKDATVKKWANQMKKDFAAIRTWEPSDSKVFAKAAMTLGEIESNTQQEVRDRAGSVQVSLARADRKNHIWTFKAAGSKGESYLIRVKAEPHGNTKEVGKLQVKISCTCNFFRWQGPEHHAKVHGYLYETPRGTASEPVIKDPTKVHWACKHIFAVINKVSKYRVASEPLWSADAEVAPDFGINASRVADRYGDLS